MLTDKVWIYTCMYNFVYVDHIMKLTLYLRFFNDEKFQGAFVRDILLQEFAKVESL